MHNMSGLYFLTPGAANLAFPDPRHAPHNLVAVGGDLRPERLLQGYRQGIFPWYSPGDPILWWSPDPRGVLLPNEAHVARSLRKTFRRHRGGLRFAFDSAFGEVLQACAAPRAREAGTWITPEMAAAYLALHRLGHAHSLELWAGSALVGGLYGVALGGVFYGESMFSRITDASKLVLVMLARQLAAWDFALIDTQFLTPHLASMGAREIPRELFLDLLPMALELPGRPGAWQLELEAEHVF
ncbi:MAG: leucyl/phenylalanyl-tRNA--protein transferase [Pseudomonadota bacterium]|uniref:leucyl/phenylalanyl-tRNA--protein transferase n=1 Tax=Thermithiobacillus tepidarius TaxID=929 RepID=UPI000419191D|nr:leucyl/phenylalanyl-tRNA--protein transferase [Thermithiobacillus tepidarius]